MLSVTALPFSVEPLSMTIVFVEALPFRSMRNTKKSCDPVAVTSTTLAFDTAV